MEMTIYIDKSRKINCATRFDIRGVIFGKDYKCIRFDENGYQATKFIPKSPHDHTNIVNEVKKEIDPNDKLFKHAKEIYDLYVEFDKKLRNLIK